MKTISTMFSGGEGVGVGARMAVLTHLWGIEYDDKIAQVARDNGFNTITADVLEVDPHTLERPDVLHASPVCTRASVANANAEEAELDKATARKTAQFIDVLRPDVFTLENVYPYRNFESFGIITDALTAAGYSWDYWHLNSADYGVPQTRQRLILIAKLGKGQYITPPPPTHHNPADYNPAQLSMFAPVTLPWVGWFEAIEDLLPTLPESQFADWQLKRLPEAVKGTFVFEPTEMRDGGIQRLQDEPLCTIKATRHGNFRAFILDGKLNDRSASLTARNGHSPVMTVTTSHNNRDVKAWLVGNNANDTSGATIAVDSKQPAQTVRTPGGGRDVRALLVDGQNMSHNTTRNGENRVFTVTGTDKG